jgi:hypothetical protein
MAILNDATSPDPPEASKKQDRPGQSDDHRVAAAWLNQAIRAREAAFHLLRYRSANETDGSNSANSNEAADACTPALHAIYLGETEKLFAMSSAIVGCGRDTD